LDPKLLLTIRFVNVNKIEIHLKERFPSLLSFEDAVTNFRCYAHLLFDQPQRVGCHVERRVL